MSKDTMQYRRIAQWLQFAVGIRTENCNQRATDL